jgi:hypothetical protein
MNLREESDAEWLAGKRDEDESFARICVLLKPSCLCEREGLS